MQTWELLQHSTARRSRDTKGKEFPVWKIEDGGEKPKDWAENPKGWTCCCCELLCGDCHVSGLSHSGDLVGVDVVPGRSSRLAATQLSSVDSAFTNVSTTGCNRVKDWLAFTELYIFAVGN